MLPTSPDLLTALTLPQTHHSRCVYTELQTSIEQLKRSLQPPSEAFSAGTSDSEVSDNVAIFSVHDQAEFHRALDRWDSARPSFPESGDCCHASNPSLRSPIRQLVVEVDNLVTAIRHTHSSPVCLPSLSATLDTEVHSQQPSNTSFYLAPPSGLSDPLIIPDDTIQTESYKSNWTGSLPDNAMWMIAPHTA